jgi:hypothetical protein
MKDADELVRRLRDRPRPWSTARRDERIQLLLQQVRDAAADLQTVELLTTYSHTERVVARNKLKDLSGLAVFTGADPEAVRNCGGDPGPEFERPGFLPY